MARQAAPATTIGVLRIREDLAKKVQALLEDPMIPGRIKYGSMRTYLERLIAQDMNERKAISDELLKDILENCDAS